MEQTKLTPQQKAGLKGLRKAYPNVQVFHDLDSEMTVAIERTGHHIKIATAICGLGETKFRKKVGEYLARSRLVSNSQCITLPAYGNPWLKEVANRVFSLGNPDYW